MNRVALGIVAIVAGLSGCATPARTITWEPATGSGVVAIPANTDVWPTYYRSAAMELIRKNVGGSGYDITGEYEWATGKQTVNNQLTNNDQTFNRQSVNNTTTTQDVTEYRIAYRKKTGPSTIGGALPNGINGAGVQQTQYRQMGAGTGVQSAGGIVPSVGPGGAVIPAGGIPAGVQGAVPAVYGNASATVGTMH